MLVEAYAPGRVELLGNHTDYNEGVVLGAAIDRGLTVRGQCSNDTTISISSTSMGRIEIDGAELRRQREQPWANYALGVVNELRSLGIPVTGFSANVDGHLPAGYGLSSSAAFEVAMAFFLLKVFERDLAPLQIAKACQRAENRFVGVQSGLLDQVTSIFGRRDHAVFFDARSEEVRLIPFPPGLALIIAQSGRQRELTDGLYNERRKETSEAAAALGLRALRDISVTELQKRDLPEPLMRRALHVVEENERVFRALNVLQEGNGRQFGMLMDESHESSRKNFENSTPELDLLVEIARELPGVLGARLTGAGFGGATVTLCEEPAVKETAVRLAREYASRVGSEPQIFVSQIADGAR